MSISLPLVVVVLLLSVYSEGAQVYPTRYTYPTAGLQSVNGSASNGGCTNSTTTSVTGVSICHSGNSSLVDGAVPTLPSSLVGMSNWAAGLFTVNRNGETSIEIGSELRRPAIERIELDLFNCPEWGIAAPNITVYRWSLFPATLPTPRRHATPLGSVTTLDSTSCNSITTVLIPLQQTVNLMIYYLEFTFDEAPSVQWVHLAEVRFFNSTPHTPTTTTMSTDTGTQPTLLQTMEPTSSIFPVGATDTLLQTMEPTSSIFPVGVTDTLLQTMEPTGSICPTVTVSVMGTPLQTVEPTSRPSMTSGEGNQQTYSIDIVAGIITAAATMGVLNIILIAVIVMLLMRRGKRQFQSSAVHYEDVQKSSRVEMKDNKAYGHSTVRVAEGGGIEKNEVYAQSRGDNTHWTLNHAPKVIYYENMLNVE